MGFGQGLSGLNAASQSLDIIGNNIANSGTVGFKAASATFADVYASSKVGLGTQVASINQRFTIGTVSGTGNEFDMAIDGAKGMFRVQDTSGNILYTRNGQFIADKNNYLVNAQGHRLTGYVGNSASPSPIQVPTGNIPPSATTGIDIKANLDANSPVLSQEGRDEAPGKVTLDDGTSAEYWYRIDTTGKLSWFDDNDDPLSPAPSGTFTTTDGTVVLDAEGQITSGQLPTTAPENSPYLPELAATPFDPNDGNTFTHSQPVDVYDSLGNAHQMTQYFVKREGGPGDVSKWDVYYRLDGKPVGAALGNGTPTTDPIEMTFDAAGRMTSGQNVSLTVANPGGVNSPADTLNINVAYNGSTQFGGEFSPSFTQNGYATGEYASMSIANDGTIVARYTNGETQPMGTLVLADFNNLQGLQPVGGNAWQETSASGQPILGVPGSNGLATLKGQAVEESNVDMSQELVNMIIAQRTYQANAQTIKTQDQILQTLITLR